MDRNLTVRQQFVDTEQHREIVDYVYLDGFQNKE